MKNNYAAFLALGTILCGGAEVGASSTNLAEQTLSFNGNLEDFSSSSSNFSSNSYHDMAMRKSNEEFVAQILGTPSTDEKTNEMTFGGLLVPVHKANLLEIERGSAYVKATKSELKNLTNKGSTLIENTKDLSITLNTFLDIFKDSFDEVSTKAGTQLTETKEDAVKSLLDALKDEAVVWGGSVKGVMNQFVSVVKRKYPNIINSLISQLRNIKFTKVKGELVALLREQGEEDTCCGCLARSALSVYQYYKRQGQDTPIVLPKEMMQFLGSGGFDGK